VIDDSALALGSSRQEHFLDDVGQGFSLGLHRAGQRVAAKRPETDLFLDDTRLVFIRQVLKDALVVDHDQRAVLLDHFAFCGEVQRHNRDAFEVDVLPDIQLGPVRQREHANRFAFVDVAVVDVPQLGPLIFRVPAVLAVTEGIHALFGTGFFFIATRTTKGGIKTVFVQSLLQALGLHDIGMLGAAVGERVNPLCHAVRVDVSDQVQAQLGDHLVAKAVHLLEFPLGIDMHHRKRQLAREKRLASKVQHHGGIFTDRVQHHRVIELGGHLADDVDAFRLQLFQVRQFVDHGYSRKLSYERPAGRVRGANASTAPSSIDGAN